MAYRVVFVRFILTSSEEEDLKYYSDLTKKSENDIKKIHVRSVKKSWKEIALQLALKTLGLM